MQITPPLDISLHGPARRIAWAQTLPTGTRQFAPPGKQRQRAAGVTRDGAFLGAGCGSALARAVAVGTYPLWLDPVASAPGGKTDATGGDGRRFVTALGPVRVAKACRACAPNSCPPRGWTQRSSAPMR